MSKRELGPPIPLGGTEIITTKQKRRKKIQTDHQADVSTRGGF